jgi:hypothetical protein
MLMAQGQWADPWIIIAPKAIIRSICGLCVHCLNLSQVGASNQSLNELSRKILVMGKKARMFFDVGHDRWDVGRQASFRVGDEASPAGKREASPSFI